LAPLHIQKRAAHETRDGGHLACRYAEMLSRLFPSAMLAQVVDRPTFEISLRSEHSGDEPFLYTLYASTREEELLLAGWDERTRIQFLQMQFAAQRSAYGGMFPEAQFDIVFSDGAAAGRIVVNRARHEIRVVDFIIAPEERNRGIGTALLQRLVAESAAAQKPLRLQVARGNRALAFYHRNGFVPTGESASHVQMEWRGPQEP
jgi:ribosomal protein S18 acetylase RimI-like enzyme